MWFQHRWYEKRLHPLLWLMTPLSLLFWLITNLRRSLYAMGVLSRYKADVPVIVVGNISVGGTGKTPMTLALVEFLRQEGFTPGIVSRGYGADTSFPHDVKTDDSSTTAGDEPLMLRHKADCPVVIAPKRPDAIKLLQQQHPKVDIIVSDDGLQHYAMQRDVELILIDAERGVGNGWLLPCGPLREGPWRLKGAEWVIALYAQHPFAQYVCEVKPEGWRRVSDSQPTELADEESYAIAGIGNPHRFFHGLEQQGVSLAKTIEFPDHHQFTESDFLELTDKPVLMTEKDAAKCREFAQPNWYFQPIRAELPEQLQASLSKRLLALKN